jgi:hypothetical protein
MNVTNYITMDYENISNWAICENEPKTKPNKPNACPPSVWRIKPGSPSVGSFWFQLFFPPAIISPYLVQPDKKLDR